MSFVKSGEQFRTSILNSINSTLPPSSYPTQAVSECSLPHIFISSDQETAFGRMPSIWPSNPVGGWTAPHHEKSSAKSSAMDVGTLPQLTRSDSSGIRTSLNCQIAITSYSYFTTPVKGKSYPPVFAPSSQISSGDNPNATMLHCCTVIKPSLVASAKTSADSVPGFNQSSSHPLAAISARFFTKTGGGK
jgi:hypothetical protein